MRYRTPCNTRSRLVGCTFAGRESNPLARYERFQLIASSYPGLVLAQAILKVADLVGVIGLDAGFRSANRSVAGSASPALW